MSSGTTGMLAVGQKHVPGPRELGRVFSEALGGAEVFGILLVGLGAWIVSHAIG